MGTSLIERITIPQEHTVRDAIQSHPLFKKLLRRSKELELGGAEFNGVVYEVQLRDLLRQGSELSRSGHSKLFALVDKASERIGVKVHARLFKAKGGGLENASICSKGSDVIVSFDNGILAALGDEESALAVVGHELGHFAFGHTEEVISREILSLHARVADAHGGAEEERFAKACIALSNDEGWDELVMLAYLCSQLSELNADRAGLVACRSFEACVRGDMILSGGPADHFGTYDPADFLKQAKQLIATGDIFDETDRYATHPLSPLRVLALEYFGNSDVYREISGEGSGKNRLEDFADLLPNIVPISLDVGGSRESGAASRVPASQPAGSSMTELEQNILAYLCMWFVIEADGKVTAAEEAYLERQIRPRAAADAALAAIDTSTDTSMDAQFKVLLDKARTLSGRSKGALIKRMIMAAKADRRIAAEEIETIREIAAAIDASELAERHIVNTWGG